MKTEEMAEMIAIVSVLYYVQTEDYAKLSPRNRKKVYHALLKLLSIHPNLSDRILNNMKAAIQETQIMSTRLLRVLETSHGPPLRTFKGRVKIRNAGVIEK